MQDGGFHQNKFFLGGVTSRLSSSGAVAGTEKRALSFHKCCASSRRAENRWAHFIVTRKNIWNFSEGTLSKGCAMKILGFRWLLESRCDFTSFYAPCFVSIFSTFMRAHCTYGSHMCKRIRPGEAKPDLDWLQWNFPQKWDCNPDLSYIPRLF